MGLFDYLTCEYKLPVEEAQNVVFQTKDTPAQFMDNYRIKADGTIWHETYDIEDQSDPNETGILRLRGIATRVNFRWEQVVFTGEIVFGCYKDKTIPEYEELNFSAYFNAGKIVELNRLI